MGRGSSLSDHEKVQIDFLYKQGVLREIGRILGRSLCIVQNYVKKQQNYAKAKCTDHRSALTVRETRAISRIASNSMKTAATMKEELNLGVSKRTIQRPFKAQDHQIRSKLKKIPCLTELHKLHRREFAKRYMETNWY